MKARLIGISRHRLAIDGHGITTLVAFFGCPLSCKFCINPQSLQRLGNEKEITPQEVLDKVKIDDLYFRATGGGITFGGGEPLLQQQFIKEFKQICPANWHISLETSFNVPFKNIEPLLALVDQFIVDCKDTNPDIYKAYTGKSNANVLANLQQLAALGYTKKVKVRVPLIEGFNTPADQKKSISVLRGLGYEEFEEFEYIK